MPTARYSTSAPTSPNRSSKSLLSFLPSSTLSSSHRTSDGYTYTSLVNVDVDEDAHSKPDVSASPRHRPVPRETRSQRWRWRWTVWCGVLTTIVITAATFGYVWFHSIHPAGQLCPIDMAAVNAQYKQLAQHHLLGTRGYRPLPPHSITASLVSSTQRLHDDVTRYRWDARRPWTWWQWLWNSPAVVMLVTRDGRELADLPSDVRSYLRVTQRMLQDMVDEWQPRAELPPYMDILINTDYADRLRDQNNSASSNTLPTTAPIFSSCSTQSSADVPFVYAEAWKRGGVYKEVESQLLLTMSHTAESTVAQWMGGECVDVTDFTTQHWATKSSTAKWRGSTTGGLYTPATFHTFARYKLALISRTNRTGLIDAKLTHCTQCEPADEMERVMRVQLGDHFQRDLIDAEQLTHYRALLDVDGNSWSSRLPQLLASGAAVLKQASPYREFWYDLLQPNVHYIELARDLSDVEAVVEAAVTRLDRGGEVAVNGLRFARQWLTEDAVRLYAQHLLSEYAALLEVPSVG